jgi:hypothetical protein
MSNISDKQFLRAITEMVPDLIWAPDFFGPREISSPRNLVLKKFGPLEIYARRNLASV